MKKIKKIYFTVVFVILIFLFAACRNKKGAEQNTEQDFISQKESMSQENTLQPSPGSNENRHAVKYIAFGDGKAVRLYSRQPEDEYDIPPVISFDIYDLAKKRVITEMDLQEYGISSVHIKAGIGEDCFYVYSGSLLSYIVFSQDGEFMSQIKLPRDCGNVVCLSDDLSKLVYQSSEPDGDGYPLIIKDLGSGEEEIAYMTAVEKGSISGFDYIHFSKDNTRIGFMGQTNPDPDKQSVDCFGYINLENHEVYMEIRDQIAVSGVNDYIAVYDARLPYGEESGGTVLLLNIKSCEKTEFTTVSNDESQFVYVIDENMFFTTFDSGSSDGKGMVEIKKYENGNLAQTYSYSYEGEADSISDICYDRETDSLFVESYSMEKLNYIVEEIE